MSFRGILATRLGSTARHGDTVSRPLPTYQGQHACAHHQGGHGGTGHGSSAFVLDDASETGPVADRVINFVGSAADPAAAPETTHLSTVVKCSRDHVPGFTSDKVTAAGVKLPPWRNSNAPQNARPLVPKILRVSTSSFLLPAQNRHS
jgi:hypothetical protein